MSGDREPWLILETGLAHWQCHWYRMFLFYLLLTSTEAKQMTSFRWMSSFVSQLPQDPVFCLKHYSFMHVTLMSQDSCISNPCLHVSIAFHSHMMSHDVIWLIPFNQQPYFSWRAGAIWQGVETHAHSAPTNGLGFDCNIKTFNATS